MKRFLKEFKDFISRGNVVDLAVAVIIGGAFSAIVTAFTNKIIMPIVNLVLSAGGDGLSSAYTFLKKVAVLDDNGNKVLDANGHEVVDLANSIFIDWGAFITAVIDFIIIALTVFLIIKFINASSKKLKALKENAKIQTNKEIREERKSIKAQAKAEGKSYKEMYAEKQAEKQKALEEEQAKQKAEEEEKAKQYRLENPTQEDLLKEIRDLLKTGR